MVFIASYLPVRPQLCPQLQSSSQKLTPASCCAKDPELLPQQLQGVSLVPSAGPSSPLPWAAPSLSQASTFLLLPSTQISANHFFFFFCRVCSYLRCAEAFTIRMLMLVPSFDLYFQIYWLDLWSEG